ncbi:hypothetical protein Pfo_015740 [Paulownia fortunei]|nr:hypothetical protein Pfo_015740 [Paulownia fortunei]
MEEWRPVFSRFHLIVIPEGFNLNLYTKSDIDRPVGSTSNALSFLGYSCWYFGNLMSHKKYIISIDDNCIPARDSKGDLIDAVTQHITNLTTMLLPFSLILSMTLSVREQILSEVTHLACKVGWTVCGCCSYIPARAMMPVSGINIGFNSGLVGPVLLPAFRLEKEGKLRLGVTSGLPCVWRKERGNAIDSLKKEWEGVKLMEDVFHFFQSLKLSSAAVTAEGCVTEIAASVKEQLGPLNPVFARAADTVVE